MSDERGDVFLPVVRWPNVPATQSHAIQLTCLSPDGLWLASAGANGSILIWSLSEAAPRAVALLEGHETAIVALCGAVFDSADVVVSGEL